MNGIKKIGCIGIIIATICSTYYTDKKISNGYMEIRINNGWKHSEVLSKEQNGIIITKGSENIISITKSELAECNINKNLEQIMANMQNPIGYKNNKKEIRDSNIGQVIYNEWTMEFTDETINYYIESGMLTNDDEVLNGMKMDGVTVSYIDGKEIINIMGQSLKGDTKDLKKQINYILDSASIK